MRLSLENLSNLRKICGEAVLSEFLTFKIEELLARLHLCQNETIKNSKVVTGLNSTSHACQEDKNS